jgi:voltage-gated potassium channel
MTRNSGRFKRESDGYLEWVRLTDTPLLALSLVFLVVLVVPIATHLSHGWSRVFSAANIVIWVAFAVDYLARLYLARDRREYVKRNVIDLVVVVVPFLRPIRALRLLRLLRLSAVGGVASRRSSSLHARVSTYVVSAAVMAVLVASVGVYDAEHRAPGANIKTLPDALWWSVTTITTVGYGDLYPTTAYGRLVAVALMIFGIALLGVITATIAAWFVGHLQAIEGQEEASAATLDDVLAELRRLHQRLDGLQVEGPAVGP